MNILYIGKTDRATIAQRYFAADKNDGSWLRFGQCEGTGKHRPDQAGISSQIGPSHCKDPVAMVYLFGAGWKGRTESFGGNAASVLLEYQVDLTSDRHPMEPIQSVPR